MSKQDLYTSITPTSPPLDPGIKAFFEEFYEISDVGTEEAHVRYASHYYTPDAVLVMGGIKRGVGTEEILAIRKSMWTTVKERSHNPVKIFAFGKPEGGEEAKDKAEVMLHGDVAYVFKDGRKGGVDWAARAEMVKQDGRWKLQFYQVFLDSAVLQNAK